MGKRKVLLIGWDAADWQVARPLMDQGKMPNLSRLCANGAWGRLETLYPVLSPMLWTSIATGKRAWKHGIHGFSEPCPQTGGIRPITQLSRNTKAIWNIFNQEGMRSNVIGWWPSHPAEPINGVMVSNHFQQAVTDVDKPWPLRPGTLHPASMEAALSELRIHPAELENAHILPFIPHAAEVDQDKDERMGSCAKIIAEVSGIHAVATYLMQQTDWDLTAVYYDAIDHFGHGFMKYHPPKQPWITDEDFHLYSNVIEAGYRYHDMMLGVLLAIAGEDATVMLLSDHGFEPGNLRPHVLPNEPAGPAAEHSPYGIFCLSGPGILKGTEIAGASLLDITPTLLHLQGLPIGRDMDGKVLVNCFENPEAPEYIDSWDQCEGEDGRHPPGAALDIADSREGLRQLVALGYIDEPNPEASIAVDETVRELRYNLAQAYQHGGLHGKAAEILQGLWDQWPNESRFGVKLLSCHLELEAADCARATLETLKQRKRERIPEAQKALEALLAEHQEANAKAQAAAEAQEDAFEPLKPDRRSQLEMRRLRGQAGCNPEAFQYLEGSVLALEGNLEAALGILEKIENVDPSNMTSLYSKIGDIQLRLERWASAIQTFEKILSMTAQDAAVHLGMARAYMGQKSYYKAAASALSSIELQFSNPHAHHLYGRALIELEQYELAEQVLLTALQQNYQLPKVHMSLARLYKHGIQRPALIQKHVKLAREIRAQVIARKRGEPLPEPVVTPELEFPAIQAWRDRLSAETKPITVVSGLPRSGTSLMMQMLEAGGMETFVDEARAADASNPKGYYEHERVKSLMWNNDRSWLQEGIGKVLKAVIPLIGFIPPKIPVRVVFMVRNPHEVLQSQGAMLKRLGRQGADLETRALWDTYASQLNAFNHIMEKRTDWELCAIHYRDAIERPDATAHTVAAFLKVPLDIAKMVASVDPKLYRERR